jgi:hypothetical protein
MSDLLRIAAVAEGKTDRSVLEAAIAALLPGRPFDLKLLQPEDPASTAPFGIQRPGGWGGVYRWCRESVARAGRLGADVVLATYDVVILHLDADVADSTYRSAGIRDAPEPTDLPCAQNCPPPSATTDALRVALLRWAGERQNPPRVVLCTPSKATETWVLAALFPTDPTVAAVNFECRKKPQDLFHGKPEPDRLVSGGKKLWERYEGKRDAIRLAWGAVRQRCTEAERFSVDFLAQAPAPAA